MWDAPDFRVPYGLKVLPIFDHAQLITAKITLAFLNVDKHAKKIKTFYQFTLLRYSRFKSSKVEKATPIFGHSHPKLKIFMIKLITLQKTLIPKVFKPTGGKLWCSSASKKSSSFLTFFRDIVKALQTWYSEDFGNVLSFGMSGHTHLKW